MLLLSCLVLFLASCAPQGEDKDPFQDARSETLTNSIRVEASLDMERLDPGQEIENQLLEEAKMEGVRLAVNEWVDKGYLVRPSKATPFSSDHSKFIASDTDFQPEELEFAQVYNQVFEVRVSLDPVEQVSGEVKEIEGRQTMAAGNFLTDLQLSELTPDEEGAFFVIVNMEGESQQSSLGQIVGSGYIYNTSGQTAQSELMETRQEIRSGDLVFLLQTEVTPVVVEEEEPEPEPVEVEREEPEVVVDPVEEPEEPEVPEEPK